MGQTQILLTASDSFGTSSFAAAGHWSNGLAPSAGNTYATSTFEIRTGTGSAYTFAGSSLALNGAGGELLLKMSNGGTVSANLIMSGGVIGIGNPNFTQSVAGTMSVTANSGIDLANSSTSSETLNLSGTISGSSSLVIGESTTSTGAGAVVVSGNNSGFSGGFMVGSNATFTEFNGSYVQVTLGAPSTLTLQVGNTNALGTGTLALSGGMVDLNGYSPTVGDLTGTGGTILNTSNGTTSTLTFGSANNPNGVFSGPIINHLVGTGLVNVTKTGTGTTTLSGNSTYTGATTVNSGVLSVTGSLGNTPVTVNNGGSLQGTGSIGGPTTINAGGALLAGTGTTGQSLSFTNGLIANSGAILDFTVGLGNTSSSLIANNVSFLGTVDIDLLGLSQAGTYTLFTGLSSAPSLSGLTLFNDAGYQATFNYSGGNIVAIVAVPEPNTFFLVVASLSLGLGLGWKRFLGRKFAQINLRG